METSLGYTIEDQREDKTRVKRLDQLDKGDWFLYDSNICQVMPTKEIDFSFGFRRVRHLGATDDFVMDCEAFVVPVEVSLVIRIQSITGENMSNIYEKVNWDSITRGIGYHEFNNFEIRDSWSGKLCDGRDISIVILVGDYNYKMIIYINRIRIGAYEKARKVDSKEALRTFLEFRT